MPGIFCFVNQRAKKVLSDSPGLVDFAIGLVNSVLNFPDGQVKIFGKFKLPNNCNQWSFKIFQASWNDFWAAHRELSCKTNFLCTLMCNLCFLYQ